MKCRIPSNGTIFLLLQPMRYLIQWSWIVLLCFCCEGFSQDSVFVVAGPEYKKSFFHSLMWGKNRRKEWTTPVRVPVVKLDTIYHGLKPVKKGGGNESKTLRLVSSDGRQYVLHSINKSRDAVTPKWLRKTYLGMIIRDGVSMSYPYGALASEGLMQSAGIYHSKPRLVYIPLQQSLDSFNNYFGNDLYLLEERPDDDWSSGAPHLGNFKTFYGTADLFDTMRSDSRFEADQKAYITGRLFDILIGDWDRNHDNWKWGAADEQSTHLYPIARDRDQAFFTRNGILMKPMMPLMRITFMQSFDHRIKNINKQTKQDRKLDELFTNAMTLDDWLSAAQHLQHALTDSAIVASVSQLPAEIFAVSGTELIDKLKSRRDRITEYASSFYSILAREVKIPGTKHKDLFKVAQMENGHVIVQVFDLTNNATTPYYQRIFVPGETKRLYLDGYGGGDTFEIDPAIKKIRITQVAPGTLKFL